MWDILHFLILIQHRFNRVGSVDMQTAHDCVRYSHTKYVLLEKYDP